MPSPSVSNSSCPPQYMCKTSGGGSHPNYTDIPPSKASRINAGGDQQQHVQSFQLRTAEETSQLEAHRFIQFAVDLEDKYKYNKYQSKDYSPYYRGLTDSSLVISRPSSPLHHRNQIEHTHHAPPAPNPTISWTSLSSFFIVRVMQELVSTNSCFHFYTKRDHHHHSRHNSNNKPPRPVSRTPSSSSASMSKSSSKQTAKTSTTLEKELKMERKKEMMEKIKDDKKTSVSTTIEKPLRESLSETTASNEAAVSPTPLSSSSSSSTPFSTPQVEHKQKKMMMDQNVNAVEDFYAFTWAEKYQPKVLQDFICNLDKATQLLALTREERCDHFIFEGPPGVGKRTMIWAMLREAFGPEAIQDCREEFKEFNLKGEVVGKIEVHVKESPQHVEVNLSELKGYEKHVILELIKDNPNWIADKALPCSLDNCRAIILYEADKLSTDALLYIKWLLERYKGCNKVFFCCSDVSKLQPIKSLCTVINLLPPSRNEIVEVLGFIAKKEGIELQHSFAEKIADNSKNNLRQAIRSFEATWLKSYPFAENTVILTGWEDDIAKIAENIIKEQSPKQLYTIRGKLQNLFEHDVSPDFIFKSLVEELKKHLDEPLKERIDLLYSEYSKKENVFDGGKAGPAQNRHNDVNDPTKKTVQQFLKIEEFIAKFMSCYKGALKNMQRHSAS